MNTWLVYQRERFPLGPNLLIACGLGTYATVVGSASSASVHEGSLSGGRVLVASLMILLFFAVLRLMDEVKDVAKDRVAHPERPLARGLIAVDAARRVIAMGMAGMFFIAGIAGAVYGPLPAALYAGTTVYLWLMYKEFYVGEWLGRWPLFYAATHQIILFPLVASGVALGIQEMPGTLDLTPLLVGGAQIFPAFFAFEVARKMAPGSHPILGTYRGVYGLRRCQLMLGGFFFLSLYGYVQAKGVFPFDRLEGGVMPLLVGLFAAAPLLMSLFKGDDGAKHVEGLATLNLLFVMYAPIVVYVYLRMMGVSQ